MSNEKFCRDCQTVKSLDDFYSKPNYDKNGNKNGKTHKSNVCKKCHNRAIDERRKHQPRVIIKKNLSKRTRSALKAQGLNKNFRTVDMLGCSPAELKQYLEERFEPGMSWENYGNPNGDHTNCWHIDHLMPCASFNLTDPEEQKKCFHYTNLFPRWGLDNIRKGAKIA